MEAGLPLLTDTRALIARVLGDGDTAMTDPGEEWVDEDQRPTSRCPHGRDCVPL